jgi:MFS family permease
MDVALDLVVDLGVLAGLFVQATAVDMALDLGLLFVPLLVRHCSSFRSLCASFGRCQPSRRAWADKSSHRPFKFATAPAKLLRVSRFGASLRAFRRVFANPRVRNVQIAGAGSTLGIWAYGVALPVYAYHSGGTRAVGLLFFARFVFAALVSPWTGVLADRWSRRKVMLASDVLRCTALAGMTAVASAGGNAYAIYVLAITTTVIGTAYNPAQAALMPSLVNSPEELTAANVVGNTVSSVGMFAGPALGGVLLALSGPSSVFALTAALNLWSAVFVLRVPGDEPAERTEPPHFLAELATGFGTVLRERALRVVIGLSAAQAVIDGAIEVLLVVVALRLIQGGDNATLGWLNTAIGIGSLIGAVFVAAVAARRRLAGGLAIGLLLSAIPLAAIAAVSTLAPTLVLVGALGAGAIFVQVNSVTLLQRSAENEVLGRVFAFLESLIMAGIAIGSIATPGLVSWLGPRGALIVAGAVLPVLLVWLWPSLRKVDAEARIAAEPLDLLRKIDIFALLEEPVLERLADGAAPVSVAAFQPVVSQGELGDRFYVIAEGRAAVEINDAESRELARGDFFGEIALLRDVPRTATVRALDPLRLYAVERDDFIAAVTGHAPTLDLAEGVVTTRLGAGALA